MTTVPNQRTLIIHRDRPKNGFLQISNSHWMDFNKKYGPFALQLYLYLAKNADNYTLALSQQAAKNEAGIAKTTFYKYIDLLVDEGYLVWKQGNTYDFYETPRKQAKETSEIPSCGKQLGPWEEQKNSSGKHRSSSDDMKTTPYNREIDNIYTHNTEKERKPNQFEKNKSPIDDMEDGFIF